MRGVKASPCDLAVDPYGAQLFWTDKEKNAIMAFSLKSKKPLGVVLDGGWRKTEVPCLVSRERVNCWITFNI